MLNVGTVVASAGLNMRGFVTNLKIMHAEGIKSADSLEKRFQRLGDTLTSVGRKGTMFLTLPLVAGMAAGVKEAADLEGALAKFDVVFGDLNQEMRDWVDQFRQDFPLARTEIVRASAALQDLLVPMGINRREATNMTKDWMELAGALSAFNDVPIEEALLAIESGIAGMSQPLRRFGIDAMQATLEQKALEMGLISAGEEMTRQVRAQALLAQAYDNSADAVNGLEQQKGSLLWVLQGLRADVRDFSGILGQDLLPIVTRTAESMRGMMASLNELDSSQRRAIIGATLLAAAIPPVTWALGFMVKNVVVATRAVRALTVAMMKNPWFLAAAAVAELTRRIIVSNRRLAENKRLIQEVLNTEVKGTQESVDRVTDAMKKQREEMRKVESYHRYMSAMGSESVEKQLQPLRDNLKALSEKRAEMGRINPELETFAQKVELGTGRLLKFTEAFEDNTDATHDNAEAQEGFSALMRQNEERIREIVDGMQELNDERLREAALLEIENAGYGRQVGLVERLIHMYARLERVQSRDRDTDIKRKVVSPVDLPEDASQRFGELSGHLLAGVDAGHNLEETLAFVGEQSERTGTSLVGWTHMAGQAFDRLIFQSEKFMDVLKSIGRQLATRGFLTLLGTLATGGTLTGAGLLAGMFGGKFHSGGIVPGSGERMALVQGGEGVFTPDQMRAMGSVGKQRVHVTVDVRGKASGQDLIFVQERASNTQIRTGRR